MQPWWAFHVINLINMFNRLTVLFLMQPHCTRQHIREFPELATSVETQKQYPCQVLSILKLLFSCLAFYSALPRLTCNALNANGTHYRFKRGAGFAFEQRQYAVTLGDYKETGTDKTPTWVYLCSQQRRRRWFIATLKWTLKLSLPVIHTHTEIPMSRNTQHKSNSFYLDPHTQTQRGKCFLTCQVRSVGVSEVQH